jgi:putative ABC transport system permease protein
VICNVLTRIASVHGDPALQIHIHPGLHPRMLLFATAISLATGIAFGLSPAIQVVRRNIVPVLKESRGCAEVSAQRWNLRNVLVVAQIAIVVVVMVGCGLCLRSLIWLRSVDLGFHAEHILVTSLSSSVWPVHDRPDLRRFFLDLQERTSRLPSIVSTSLAGTAPVGEASGRTIVTGMEGVGTLPSEGLSVLTAMVGVGYFETIGQSLLAGRSFSIHDGPDAPKAVIVNEVLSHRYWPNEDPIGKRVTFGRASDGATDIREIIGVVSAVKLRSIVEESIPVCYFSLAQYPKYTPLLLMRTTADPQDLVPLIRKEAAALGPEIPCDVSTVTERISGLLLPQQLLTCILNSFALVGLLLSATGIYAVMAYAVRQRTREIGIRMALGARGCDVLAFVLVRGARLVVPGLCLGLGLSLIGTQLLTSLLPQIREWDKYFLYGVCTWDPLTYVGATLTITLVALLACYVPAAHAARIDPVAAVRCEE